MSSSGKAKLDQVNQLLDQLSADFDSSKLSSTQRKQLLEQLKVHGRSAQNADPIFTEKGIRTLSRYAFDQDDVQSSQEALRCIANALLLTPTTRQILVDLGYAPKAAEKLKNDSIDDEFLCSRILFLLTYSTTLDYPSLIAKHGLASNINDALSRHANRYSNASAQQQSDKHTSPMDIMALSETLKLLFNITHHYPDLTSHFSQSIPSIFTILVHRKLPTPPLEAPVSYLINALINLDLEDKSGAQQEAYGMNAVFPTSSPSVNAEHLITILDAAIRAYTESELDTTISPLVTLIRRIYEIAPPAVKKAMESLLLPSDAERAQPLGRSNTLSSRLLQLSTSAMTPTLRGSISAMLFELSGKDASKFVQNVGYGYASGFLLSNNIPMPENAMEEHAAATQESGGIPVNPITGQRLDMEEPDTSEPMTMEEREREAERLFVLFERLRATGVVNVQNPVTEAYQSGRIQELSDDEVD